MKTKCNKIKVRALTRVELLVIVATVTLLGGLLIPTTSKPGPRAQRLMCISNLKQIGLAFRLFSNDHGDQFPWRVSLAKEAPAIASTTPDLALLFSAVGTNLVSPKVLACPSDRAVVNATSLAALSRSNISYFICLDAGEDRPQSLLSGDRNITGGVLSNGIYYLSAQSGRVGWDSNMHGSAGNIALADGSAQQMTTQGLTKQVQTMTNQVVRLLVP